VNASVSTRPWFWAGGAWPNSAMTVGATSTFSACCGLSSVSSNRSPWRPSIACWRTWLPPETIANVWSSVVGAPWLPLSGLVGSPKDCDVLAVTRRSPVRSPAMCQPGGPRRA
jgi:hypothetical protein